MNEIERLARQNLAQIERWCATTEHERRMKFMNAAQVRRYLDSMRTEDSA